MKRVSTEDFRGYEFLNPACTNASLTMLAEAKATRRIFENTLLPKEVSQEFEVPQFAQASLDFLESQGIIELNPNGYGFTREGLVLAQDIESIKLGVSVYSAVAQVLKRDLGWRHEEHPIARLSLMWPEDIKQVDKRLLEGLIPAAATFLRETKIENEDGSFETAAELLSKGGVLDVEQCGGNSSPFIKTLKAVEVLSGDNGTVSATERGKKLLRLSGYAELILSYYPMMENMEALADGRLSYGLNGDVNRDAEFNANASNGIIKIKVGPNICSTLEEDKWLRGESVGGAFIDYGSGGGDMLTEVMRGNRMPRKAFGIDINPLANKEAKRLTQEARLSGKIDYYTGSMTDHITLQKVRAQMEREKISKVVACTNWITHELCEEQLKQFLYAHSGVFKEAPLFITETNRIPMEVLKKRPNYQAPSFQYMHTASGQNLRTEEQLEDILKECNYGISRKKSHSSMQGISEEKDDRHTTIATWVTAHQRLA